MNLLFLSGGGGVEGKPQEESNSESGSLSE